MTSEFPEIKAANRIVGAPLGTRHTVVLFDKVRIAGPGRFAYLVIVYSNIAREPVFAVASQVLPPASTEGSNVLVVFDDKGRSERTVSNDWADGKLFFAEALRLAGEAFGAVPPVM